MLKKHIPTLFALTAVLTLGVSLYTNIQKAPVETTADQVDYNFAPYTYSGSYYSDKNIDFNAGDGMDGALRQKLSSDNRPKSYVTYSAGLSEHLQQADEDQNNTSNMVLFYTRDSVTKHGATDWNREHVWPKNLSNNNWSAQHNGTEKCGTDLLHLRPTYNTPNSTRSNYPFGNVTHNNSTKKTYEGMDYGWLADGYFEPLDCVKGDVARIIMYVWTTYTDFPNYNPISITKVFESYNTLLEWHTMDKPDTLEGHRNDYVQNETIQKNRNPFVDHPELAWKVFGDAQGLSESVKNACMATYPDNGGVHVDPTGISINKSTATVTVGKTIQLNASLEPFGATGTITWASNNTSVATVNNSGKVTGVAPGTATITATCGAYSASCKVTVEEAVPINYGTKDNPISVAEAKAIISEESPTKEKITLKGIVTSATYNTQYHNFDNVYLTDGENENALTLFRSVLGTGVDTSYTTDASSLVGKEVVAEGYGLFYNNTKYELAKEDTHNFVPTILSVNDPQPIVTTPKEKIEAKTTATSLAYRYTKETTGGSSITDTLTRTTTGATGTTYIDWTHTSPNSDVAYKGQSSGGNNVIQLKSKDNCSGIVTTSNPNENKATSVTVSWNTSTTSGRTLNIYGKNTAYSAVTDLYNDDKQGALIGTIVYGTSTSLTITGEYTFIGIRSSNGALWLDEINIQWGGSSATFEYSDVSIRFGGVIEKDLWSELDTDSHIITGFGVVITSGDLINNDNDFLEAINEAVPSTESTDLTQELAIDYFVPIANMDAIIGEDDDNYFWNLRFAITDLNAKYAAAAYIKTDSDTIYLKRANYSAKTLAQDYMKNRNCNSTTAGGSLANLANI